MAEGSTDDRITDRLPSRLKLRHPPFQTPAPLDKDGNVRTSKTCADRIKAIQDRTDRIAGIKNDVARNKQITAAYNDMYGSDPNNKWAGLGAIASAQTGCNMYPGVQGALGDANRSIFSDIYPYMAYRREYGYENMKKCYKETGKTIPKKIERSFEKYDAGNYRGAADEIADYEQRDVVQSAYNRHPYAFWVAGKGDSASKLLGYGSAYSIPVSQTCGATPRIPFEGDISNPNARVNYYEKLMDIFQSR